MILEFIVSLNYFLFMSIFGLLPNLPAMPKMITDILIQISVYLNQSVGIIKFLIGVEFVNVILFLIVALLGFKYALLLSMFIIKKLPIGVK